MYKRQRNDQAAPHKHVAPQRPTLVSLQVILTCRRGRSGQRVHEPSDKGSTSDGKKGAVASERRGEPSQDRVPAGQRALCALTHDNEILRTRIRFEPECWVIYLLCICNGNDRASRGKPLARDMRVPSTPESHAAALIAERAWDELQRRYGDQTAHLLSLIHI